MTRSKHKDAAVESLLQEAEGALASNANGNAVFFAHDSAISQAQSVLQRYFITNNLIQLNQANEGGGIFCSSGTPLILNNLVISNTALVTGGTTTRPGGGGIALSFCPGVIANNLIVNGSSGVRFQFSPPTTLPLNNCVFGNTNYNYSGIDDPAGTNGNISVDPLLVSSKDFHLAAGSPCIDAGDNSAIESGWLDVEGRVRRAGARVDIGAAESGSSRPFLLSLLLETGSAPTLRLAGESGRTYVLEVSTNLTSWSAVKTNVAMDGTLEWPDAEASTIGQRYYRAVAPAP